MNATRPEASTEYSRGTEVSSADSGALRGRDSQSRSRVPASLRLGLLIGGLTGAGLLLVAEFTPLLSVHTSASRAAVKTVTTGSNHAYALIPIALLAGFLTYSVWRSQSRLALTATGLLGVLALLIALLGDLPDAQATGLIGSAATKFVAAKASPSIGFYRETLGGVVLLMTAGAGLLLLPGPARPRRVAAPPNESAS
jgi:hypothetical protein